LILSEEEIVVRVITFDKGSKRQMRRIQWRGMEIASMILLAIFTLTIAGLVLFWELSHYSFESDTPHLQDRR
jgi:NhaP-type Na+/H+ or K+/H+ antiporter